MPVIQCKRCGKDKFHSVALISYGYGKFCSGSCAAKSRFDSDNKSGAMLKKAKKSGDCLLFSGKSINNAGYGSTSLNGKHISAHRKSYIINVGPIPNGMFVLHKCDNRLCIKPGHLFLGTQQDNIIDMYKKNRGNNSARINKDG